MNRILTWLAGSLAVVTLGFVLYAALLSNKERPPTVGMVGPGSVQYQLKPAPAGAQAPQSVAPASQSPQAPQPQVVQKPVTSKVSATDDAAASNESTTPEIEQPSPQPKVFPSWDALESEFEALRRKRKQTNVGWVHDLHNLYGRMSSPNSTGSEDYPTHIAKLGQWRDALPQSPTPLIVLAQAHIQWAWEARGSGWAGSVTEEGWELFHTRLVETRRLLEKAVELGPKDGQAHRLLVQLAMATDVSEDQAEAWLAEGRQLDPLYIPLYTTRAIALMPRWGGEQGDVERFAKQVTEWLSGDDGLEAFGQIAVEIHQYECNDPVTLQYGEYDRELLLKAVDVLSQRYPHWESGVHFTALCALIHQDRALAQKVRPLLKEFKAELRIWPWKGSFDQFVQWCDIANDPTEYEQWVWGTHFPDAKLSFAPNSRYVWCAHAYGARAATLLDLESGGLKQALPAVGRNLEHVTFDNAKRWVLGAVSNDSLEGFSGWVLWNSANPLDVFPRPSEHPVQGIAINPAKGQIAWTEDLQLHLFDIERGEIERTIEFAHPPSKLWYSPDGTLIAVVGSPSCVFHVATGEKKYELPYASHMPQPPVTCAQILGFDTDNQLWAIGHGKSTKPNGPVFTPVIRFDANGANHTTMLNKLTMAGHDAQSAVLSHNRQLLAVPERFAANGGSQAIQIWDIAQQKLVKRFGGHYNHHGAMAFSEDDKRLATISRMGGPIRVWSLEDRASEPAADASGQ